MAIYRWRQSTVSDQETRETLSAHTIVAIASKTVYINPSVPQWTGSYYNFSAATPSSGNNAYGYLAFTTSPTIYYDGEISKGWKDGAEYWMSSANGCTLVSRSPSAGTFVSYVYSTNSSAYPNGGVSGEYYYDQMQEVDFTATIDVPIQAMQGNQIAVSWSAVDGADGYILERKANTDSDWTQVYSGANTSFEETVGTWTSVQYRVKAGVSGTYGDYTTSAVISVVSASALVISGSDGDLGTLVNDVTYTVSSDGSTELTVVETINGTETRTFTATNGATNKIPVVDLPTGYGTISITASTNPGSGVVTVTREWTYTKAAITFPDAGSVADLIQNGQTIWAKTIAEAVRTPSIWGGNLGLALAKLANAVLYDPETGGFNGIGGADATIPMVSIETGSYVGTGTSGASNPNSLTFSFEPKLVLVQVDDTKVNSLGIFIYGTNYAISYFSSTGPITINVSWENNKITFYSSRGDAYQLNKSGYIYYYVAIG